LSCIEDGAACDDREPVRAKRKEAVVRTIGDLGERRPRPIPTVFPQNAVRLPRLDDALVDQPAKHPIGVRDSGGRLDVLINDYLEVIPHSDETLRPTN
jgi:hypothetical protein